LTLWYCGTNIPKYGGNVAGILNLSESVLIALHSLILIAQRSPEPVRTKEIAEITGASENTTAKVMQRLSRAGFIASTRGPAGGFRLDKDPAGISFLQIFEAMEGKLVEEKCLFHCSTCLFGTCIFGDFLHRMTGEFRERLTEKTLAAYVQTGTSGDRKQGPVLSRSDSVDGKNPGTNDW
jgi:Rrf2 family protein